MNDSAKPVGAIENIPLIPRTVLFGNPDKAGAQISPDGAHISYLAPVDGVLNVWVGPADNPDAAKPVTDDRKRGIRSYFWAYTNNHILYIQDKEGDENWHVFAVDLAANTTTNLTPIPGARAEIEEVSHKFPEEILIGLNDRDPQFHDIYRVNILTGDKQLLQKNEEFAGFLTDDDYRIRFALRMTPDGGQEILQPAADGAWGPFMEIAMDDSMTTHPAGFDKSGRVMYLLDSRGRDTAALFTLNLDNSEKALVAENPKSDLADAMAHPTEKTLQAVAFNYERKHWQVLDPAVQEDFDKLRTVADGDFEIISRTLDDKIWLVAYLLDNGPVRYYHYDRAAKSARFLFTNRKDLEGQPLVRMHPVIIPTRDGLEMVSYLTLPATSDAGGAARPKAPVPMVLLVHGGPWVRSAWGFDSQHQWFANRGYAVLDINYRGSTGFGKRFINASNKEWGAAMHHDLIDAVQWAVKEGIANPDKVAIYGGSYGGYAALSGLTLTPDAFTCGVSIVGPSNLVTLIESIPPYWKPALALFTARVGDPATEDGRAFLLKRSPLTYAEQIKRPLLIGQGANDPRVKQAESDQIVAAMKKHNIPVTYVIYPDEGHGFARPENRLSFNAVAEAFLANTLGGRFEPVDGAFEGSTITVNTGADYVPGLQKALDTHAQQKP